MCICVITDFTFHRSKNEEGFFQPRSFSLLLLGLEDLSLNSVDLSKHNNTVAIHEGNTGETFAVLEGIGNKGLLGFEGDLGHLVGLEGVGFFHLLTTGLLTHLPLEGGDTARRTSATHETNGRVSDLDFIGNVKDLDLSVEVLHRGKGSVLLVPM